MPWKTVVLAALFLLVMVIAVMSRTTELEGPSAPAPHSTTPTQDWIYPPQPRPAMGEWPRPLITPGKDYLPWGI